MQFEYMQTHFIHMYAYIDMSTNLTYSCCKNVRKNNKVKMLYSLGMNGSRMAPLHMIIMHANTFMLIILLLNVLFLFDF